MSHRLLSRLKDIGIAVDSVYDLVNRSKPYTAAIPLLLDSLENDDLDNLTREGIVRALTVKEAKGIANDALLRFYESTPIDEEILRWVVGNAFSIIIQMEDLPTVLRLVKEKKNGMSRQMFVMALAKFAAYPEVETTVIDLLEDPDVVLHAISALKAMRSVKPYQKIERMAVFSDSSAVKKEARKYLRKIGDTN